MHNTPDAILVRTPGTCGGLLRIDGTRITVLQIAALSNAGLTAADITGRYPHLTLGQVYTALAYYHNNKVEVDRELAEQEAEFDRLKAEAESKRRDAS
jgi:uncharacterized protein (DUF433 family)